MQCIEFYRCFENKSFNPIEGRWRWELCLSAFDYGRKSVHIEWTDMFGHFPKVAFDLGICGNRAEFNALTRRFGVFYNHLYDASSFRILDFDWQTQTCRFDLETFMPFPDRLQHNFLPDRAGSCPKSGDLKFLFYDAGQKAIYYRIDATRRQILQIGEPFVLPVKKFLCLDLNDDIISGLDESLEAVNRFDARSQRFLDRIDIYGLPQSVNSPLCDSVEFLPSDPVRIAPAWTHDRLFVWSGEDFENTGNSQITLYAVNLNTGVANEMGPSFEGNIHHLGVERDNFLYVHNTIFLRNDELHENSGLELEDADYQTFLAVNQFFRIPFRTPESLFLLAYGALPRPIPTVARQLMDRRDDLPTQAYRELIKVDEQEEQTLYQFFYGVWQRCKSYFVGWI